MAVPSTPLQEIRTCVPIPLIGLNSFIVEQVGSSDKGLNSWGSVDEPMGALSRPLDENRSSICGSGERFWPIPHKCF